MKRGALVGAITAVALALAACAPASPEQAAAMARPAGKTGENERFWRSETRGEIKNAVERLEADCSGAENCLNARFTAAWPASTEYQPYCQLTPSFVAAQCLVEYEFWAVMGRKYYPSYRVRDAWASFDLPNNPTWREWYTDRLLRCDPQMNKDQEVGDVCVGDHAKRDFKIDHDARRGCVYGDNPSLSSLCYWMAGFDQFAKARIGMLGIDG